MGYISNQFIGKGEGLRNKSYRPSRVRISFTKDTDPFSHGHKVPAKLTATKENGEIQTLRLSVEEADEVGNALLSCMTQKGRERLLHSLLRELSHAKLLRSLAFDLRKRVRLPKDG